MINRVSTQYALNGALRYGIYDSSGTLIRYEYIKLEDEPSVAGTDLNQASLLSGAVSQAIMGDANDHTVSEALGTLNTYKASLTSGKITPSQLGITSVSVASSKTLALTDANTLQVVNSASTINITIPNNTSVAFPIGTTIDILRYGTGAVSVAVSGSVYTNGATATISIYSQYGIIALVKVNTNSWIVMGDI
jgi:hypothetical protein